MGEYDVGNLPEKLCRWGVRHCQPCFWTYYRFDHEFTLVGHTITISSLRLSVTPRTILACTTGPPNRDYASSKEMRCPCGLVLAEGQGHYCWCVPESCSTEHLEQILNFALYRTVLEATREQYAIFKWAYEENDKRESALLYKRKLTKTVVGARIQCHWW